MRSEDRKYEDQKCENKRYEGMGKKVYDDIEIPAELHDVVEQAIASRKKSSMNVRKAVIIRAFRYAATAAAGLLICLTVGLNTSEAFAKEMQELPVIGQLAKVLTIRSYHGKEGDYEMDIEVPEIVIESEATGEAADDAAGIGNLPADDTAGGESTPADGASAGENVAQGLESLENDSFTADINAEIQRIVDDYVAQAKTDMEESKKAFFETGGTEEQWNDRTMDIYVDYNVKYQQGNILSLELITAKAWVASQEERHYYNLDLEKGTNLTLEQLLGEDYIRLASESIIAQIEARVAEDENQMYFGYGPNDDGMIEGFQELSPDAMFYINEKGNVVIVFNEYEIAPGYMGFPEFEIQ